MSESIMQVILHYGVPIVALMLFAGEIGIPTIVPMELALLLAGAYTVYSLSGLLVAVMLVAVADLTGTMTLHLVARTGGVRLLSRLLRGHHQQGERFLANCRRHLGERDIAIVFVGRLLPLMRMYLAIGVGLMHIPLRSFLLGAAPAALLWAGTPLTLGYFFRANVQRFEARYTALSHILLFALPMMGLISALVWWVRQGAEGAGKIHRMRIALGLAAAGGCVAYLIRALWLQERVIDLPLPILAVWLALLGGIAVILLRQAITDLQRTRTIASSPSSVSGSVRGELVTTLLWVTSLSLAGVVITGIELRYPAL